MRCDNNAKFYVHWPGSGAQVACESCAGNALSIARSLGITIVVEDIEYDRARESESDSEDTEGQVH